MISLAFPILFFGLSLQALASAPLSASVFSKSGPTLAINATVTDHNGLDITSSFQIMLYNEYENSNAITNITDRRRQTTRLSRAIIDCSVPNAVFIGSVCTYGNNKASGMQGWKISCYTMKDYQDPTARRYYLDLPTLIQRDGRCNDDEICVDGPGRGGMSRYDQHSVASCVKTQYFTRMISNAGKPASERHQITDLEGKQAQMVVSKSDGSTPLEVDSFDLEAVDANGNTVQSKKCRDCMELKTDILGPQTDNLKAQATLLTTGAVTGILWLAVLSG